MSSSVYHAHSLSGRPSKASRNDLRRAPPLLTTRSWTTLESEEPGLARKGGVRLGSQHGIHLSR